MASFISQCRPPTLYGRQLSRSLAELRTEERLAEAEAADEQLLGLIKNRSRSDNASLWRRREGEEEKEAKTGRGPGTETEEASPFVLPWTNFVSQRRRATIAATTKVGKVFSYIHLY